jgi:hypothetical protein
MKHNDQTIPHNKHREFWENIDYKRMENNLENDYKSYLTNRLKEYNKVDFTIENIEHIHDMHNIMTASKNPAILSNYLQNDIIDDKKNSFLHSAIQKKDLVVLQWLVESIQCAPYLPNSDGKEPIDLCIDQLMPHAEESNKQTAHEMLDILTAGYDKANFDREHRENFLKKLVTLHLEHTKHATNFKLKDILFSRFLRKNSTLDSIDLSAIYQSVCDSNGNGFSHILVQQHLSDMLHEFIQKNYISFKPNKEGKNPITIAEEIFETLIVDPQTSMENNPDIFKRSRCCLFMLLNYIKKQNNINFEHCCHKHPF